METIIKIQSAIIEVRTNPKYRINRKLILNLLEKRLVMEEAKIDFISLNEENLVNWCEK